MPVLSLIRLLGIATGWLLHFALAEAAVISVLGGVIGLSVSIGIVWLMNYILTQAIPTQAVATLDWKIMAQGLGFSVIVGLVAGVYPALRAAKLDPIEALRHE